MMRRWIAVGVACLACASGITSQLSAYPGGTPRAVTNASPFCANCHSSTSTDQLREMPAEGAAGMLPDRRHYTEISSGAEDYAKLSADDRQKLDRRASCRERVYSSV